MVSPFLGLLYQILHVCWYAIHTGSFVPTCLFKGMNDKEHSIRSVHAGRGGPTSVSHCDVSLDTPLAPLARPLEVILPHLLYLALHETTYLGPICHTQDAVPLVTYAQWMYGFTHNGRNSNCLSKTENLMQGRGGAIAPVFGPTFSDARYPVQPLVLFPVIVRLLVVTEIRYSHLYGILYYRRFCRRLRFRLAQKTLYSIHIECTSSFIRWVALLYSRQRTWAIPLSDSIFSFPRR